MTDGLAPGSELTAVQTATFKFPIFGDPARPGAIMVPVDLAPDEALFVIGQVLGLMDQLARQRAAGPIIVPGGLVVPK